MFVFFWVKEWDFHDIKKGKHVSFFLFPTFTYTTKRVWSTHSEVWHIQDICKSVYKSACSLSFRLFVWQNVIYAIRQRIYKCTRGKLLTNFLENFTVFLLLSSMPFAHGQETEYSHQFVRLSVNTLNTIYEVVRVFKFSFMGTRWIPSF